MIFLRRYTDLSLLLHILRTHEVPLINLSNCDDRNDASLIEYYKKKKNLKTVLSLSFIQTSEAYHHWKTYSDKSSVCFDLDKELFLKSIIELNDFTVKADSVRYIKIKEAERAMYRIDDLPYVKNTYNRDEKEFRLIYEDKDIVVDSKSLHFDVKSIYKVTLNPWLPEPARIILRDLILSISADSRLKIESIQRVF